MGLTNRRMRWEVGGKERGLVSSVLPATLLRKEEKKRGRGGGRGGAGERDIGGEKVHDAPWPDMKDEANGPTATPGPTR